MINVSKTWLPPQDRYLAIMNRAWQKGWITNNGELVLELETLLRQYLDVQHLLYTSNGTIALQLPIKYCGAGLGGEIITTPYSYVATSHSIWWEGFTPVFADIATDSFGICPKAVEAAITENTRAIVATHVYGLPCQTEALEAIGRQYKLPVIYDGAHAFGTRWKGKSLLSYGDFSTCSFHATKLFHTVEGGCIISNSEKAFSVLEGYRQFGHKGDVHYSPGINAKNSELHAAMGLAMLPEVPALIAERKKLFEVYEQAFRNCDVQYIQPHFLKQAEWNYAYFPVIFSSETVLLQVKAALEAQQIFPRRYFYPALHTLPYWQTKQATGIHCPRAQWMASRVLCLPFYNGLEEETMLHIANTVKNIIQQEE